MAPLSRTIRGAGSGQPGADTRKVLLNEHFCRGPRSATLVSCYQPQKVK
jgi:hypothetical protein